MNSKGQKEREVALSPRTLQALGDYMGLRKDTSPFLIVTEEGQPLTYRGVASLFQRWKRAANGAFSGVRLSPHTLRYTSATMRRIAGMSEGDLQTFLGHNSLVMTRHYPVFALARSANAAALRTSPVEYLDRHDLSRSDNRLATVDKEQYHMQQRQEGAAMVMAYILFKTIIGASAQVADSLRALQEVQYAYSVSGPHDVIAKVETVDEVALGGFITEKVHRVGGVVRTQTCVVVPQR